MSANFEIQLVGHKYLQLEKLILLFKVIGEHPSLEHIMAYPDWSLSKEAGELIEPEKIENRLQSGAIICINGTIKDTRIGILEYIENDKFFYSLWINTAQFQALDSDFVRPDNIIFYDMFRSVLAGTFHYSITFAALGSEILVEIQEDPEAMIVANRNVSMWFFTPPASIARLPGYDQQVDSQGNIILSKIET